MLDNVSAWLKRGQHYPFGRKVSAPNGRPLALGFWSFHDLASHDDVRHESGFSTFVREASSVYGIEVPATTRRKTKQKLVGPKWLQDVSRRLLDNAAIQCFIYLCIWGNGCMRLFYHMNTTYDTVVNIVDGVTLGVLLCRQLVAPHDVVIKLFGETLFRSIGECKTCFAASWHGAMHHFGIVWSDGPTCLDPYAMINQKIR